MMRAFVCCLLCALLGGTARVPAAELRWPTACVEGVVPAIDAQAVLGRPDLRLADFRAGDSSATYSAFTLTESFSPPALAGLLGVPLETLAAADVVAFEAWGTSFENSVWTFAGDGVALTVTAPDDALATGTLTLAGYAAFFGLPGEFGNDVMPWALLDTGPVPATAADFRVEVVRGWGPHGSPDLDAIGLLVDVAVPVAPRSWSGVRALYR
jgi:hypothetical protein